MDSTSDYGGRADDAPDLAGSDSFPERHMLNEEHTFTDSYGRWNEEFDQYSNDGEDHEESMNDLVNNMDVFASIGLDQQLVGDHQQQHCGNRQGHGNYAAPSINYDQHHRNVNMNHTENNNDDSDASYQQFFQEMMDSEFAEQEESIPHWQSSFVGMGTQADQIGDMPGGLVPRSVTSSMLSSLQFNTESDDVFAIDNQLSMSQFQHQLGVTQMQTEPFKLQEPPRFRRSKSSKSSKSKTSTTDSHTDLKLRNSNARDISRAARIPQASPTEFPAPRRDFSARPGMIQKPFERHPKQTTDMAEKDRRAKRPRVIAEIETVEGGQRGRRPDKILPVAEVPEQYILRSNGESQCDQVCGTHTEGMVEATRVLREQPRIANQQMMAPRKPDLLKPGMGMFQLQSNNPSSPESSLPVNSQTFTAPPHLDAFGPISLFNSDRLQTPQSMIVEPSTTPGVPSPITPSLRFPFDVFKYPTGEHYTNYLGAQVLKLLYENFYQDVTSVPLPQIGKLPPTTLMDTAVQYFKMLNWDHPMQLNMIYFITILHHSQQAGLHQFLWELFRAANMVQRTNCESIIMVETVQTLKWQIIRLTLLVLKHDMTEFSTRENPVFGRKVGPASWKVYHERTTIWQALGIQDVKGEPGLWIDRFMALVKPKFYEAGINPNESPVPVPQAEDEPGFI